MKIKIPDFGDIEIRHLVLDFNGSIACDGKLLPDIGKYFNEIVQKDMTIHVITADTHGTVAAQVKDLPCTVTVIPKINQDQEKENYINTLQADHVIAAGNGRNDRKMLKAAKIGIALLQDEGLCVETLQNADILVKDVRDAFGMILKPNRLIATLRR